MAAVTFLLPPAEAFGAQRLGPGGARLLGRADRLPPATAGPAAQLLRHFALQPAGSWPIAALTRQADCGDAAGAIWLHADPAWIRPDINGARLLACGEGMRLSPEDSAALVPAVRPVFGDAGFPLDAPDPARWYLRLPANAEAPAFAPPSEALGTDLTDQLEDDGPAARRWRALLNEAQIVLHNHPWNARRIERGLVPVNSLWLWGGGALPDRVDTGHRAVAADEEALRALAVAGGAEALPRGQGFRPGGAASLVDLRALRDLRLFADAWLGPALAAVADRKLDALVLDLEDGSGYRFTRRQRWRFWRGPQASLEA